MIHDYDLYDKRFREYVASTRSKDDFIQEHLDLKAEHTFRVVENIYQIARNSGLNEDEITTAKLIALVHDIGRFEQFIKYRTFDDSQSVNHAELGVQILKKTGFLKELDKVSELLVYEAIMNHNVSKLDEGIDKNVLHFARLIRDADKVDIWYILTQRDVVNKILNDISQEKSYIVPDFILDAYRKGVTVPSATSMNDYRLLRLSWIYDMNFPATFALVLKRDYIDRILSKVPRSKEKEEIAGIIYRYVHEKAGMHQEPSQRILPMQPQ
jgi:putative nucleotidyltransferase with HDIG domain